MTSLNDFGAGYSVLNSVLDIPANTVKIDKTLLKKCQNSERGRYYMKQMITMVKGWGTGWSVREWKQRSRWSC